MEHKNLIFISRLGVKLWQIQQAITIHLQFKYLKV